MSFFFALPNNDGHCTFFHNKEVKYHFKRRIMNGYIFTFKGWISLFIATFL